MRAGRCGSAKFPIPFESPWGHRLLSQHLSEAGIAHEHRENSGNHGGRANERYQVTLTSPVSSNTTDPNLMCPSAVTIA
jgi:hypothetical protein